jgi:hypothetical protein
MAKNKVSEWSSTPANNTDIANIDIAEGCAPSGVNNAIREMMAQVKDMQAGTDGDNFTVGGNLSVVNDSVFTGTVLIGETLTSAGVITGTSGFSGNLTGNVTGNCSGTSLNVTGTVAVANGGTGLTTLTANNVMLGNGTSTPSFVAPETSGNVLTSNGTTWISVKPEALVAGTAQASTSGTSINFESIPSWVKRINVIFSSVSTTGTSDYMIQIGGDSIETSGYAGSFGTITTGTAQGPSAPTTGFVVVDASVGEATSAVLYSGIATLAKISGSTWVLSSVMSRGTQGAIMAGGTKTITGTLSKVRVTTQAGVNTFDSGLINIFYE